MSSTWAAVVLLTAGSPGQPCPQAGSFLKQLHAAHARMHDGWGTWLPQAAASDACLHVWHSAQKLRRRQHPTPTHKTSHGGAGRLTTLSRVGGHAPFLGNPCLDVCQSCALQSAGQPQPGIARGRSVMQCGAAAAWAYLVPVHMCRQAQDYGPHALLCALHHAAHAQICIDCFAVERTEQGFQLCKEQAS